MDAEDEVPRSKRPRLQNAEDEDRSTMELLDSDFKHRLRTFVSDYDITVKDFERLFHHLESVLGAESMADLVELQIEDLSEEKTGSWLAVTSVIKCHWHVWATPTTLIRKQTPSVF